MTKRRSLDDPRATLKRSAPESSIEPWRQLLYRSSETLARGDYELAIDEASAAASELLRACLVPILDIRAMAHAKGSYFMEGLNDARRMIRYAPDSAEGYLRVGSLYVMQGKPWEALKVYEDGLASVPISHNKYQQLVDGIQKAKKQDQKRINIVDFLPTEILSNIFIRLSTDTLAVCMNVSTEWRERLARCAEAWRSIQVINGEVSTKIAFVAAHVRHLRLVCSDTTVEQRVIRLLKAGAFRCLESLNMDRDRNEPSHIGNPHLSAVLSQTRSTLRRLELHSTRSDILSFVDVLSLCPNLTDLAYSTSGSSVLPVSTSFNHQLPTRLELVNLCLWTQHMQPTDLEWVIRRCPDLRGLVVHKSFMAAALLQSEQYCPRLETLYINRYLSLSELMSVNCNNNSNQIGMRRFSICSGDRIDFGTIIPLLKRNSNTLEEFRLELNDYAPGALQQWHPFTNVTFTRLHTLHCGIGRYTDETVADMIRQSPALEKFTIVYSNMTVSSSIFNALASLHHLRALSIFSTDQVSRSGLESFFERHADRQNTSRLAYVLLTCGKGVSDAALASLAQIQTLRTISISNCLDTSVEGFNHFAHLLRRSRSLESLTLEDIDQVRDTAVERLGVIRSLKWVAFFGLTHVTHEGMVHLIDSSINLQSISVDHGDLARDDILKSAAKKGIRIEGI